MPAIQPQQWLHCCIRIRQLVSLNHRRPAQVQRGDTANLDVTTYKGGVNKGLGHEHNDAPYVGPTDAIVLDLSNVKATLGGAKN